MKRTISFLFILSLFFVAPLAFAANPSTSAGGNTGDPSTAAGGNPGGGGGEAVTLNNPLSAPDLPHFLNQILGFFIQIGGIVIVFMIVYVGFKFVMAQGEPGPLGEAKKMLMWTLIGAAILLGAQAISVAIASTVQAIS